MKHLRKVLPLVPTAGVAGGVMLIGLTEYVAARMLRRLGGVPLIR